MAHSLQEHLINIIQSYGIDKSERPDMTLSLQYNILHVTSSAMMETIEIDLDERVIRVYSRAHYETSGDDQILDIGSDLLQSINY